MNTYTELRPNSKSAFNGEKEWRKEAYSTWRCQCSWPKKDIRGPIDVVVMNPTRKTPVDFLFGFSGFCIASTSLVDALGWSEISDWFHIGSVKDSSKKTLETFVTLRSKDNLVYLRNGPQSPRRWCNACGRLILGAFDNPYLCSLDEERIILQSTFGSLLLHSDYCKEKLSDMNLSTVKLRPLEVRAEPEDGLPADLNKVMFKDVKGSD